VGQSRHPVSYCRQKGEGAHFSNCRSVTAHLSLSRSRLAQSITVSPLEHHSQSSHCCPTIGHSATRDRRTRTDRRTDRRVQSQSTPLTLLFSPPTTPHHSFSVFSRSECLYVPVGTFWCFVCRFQAPFVFACTRLLLHAMAMTDRLADCLVAVEDMSIII
jgi:hypothetical protein